MLIRYTLLLCLVACGASPENNALTQDIGASGSLTVSVHHLGYGVPNITVLLDATGDVYSQTDSAGDAIFSDVSAGNHDIHVLDDQGAWISMFAVSGSRVFVDLQRPTLSYINISGSVSNLTNNSKTIQILFQDSVSTAFVGNSTPATSNHAGSLNLQQTTAGSTLTGDVFFLETETIANISTVVDVLPFLSQTKTSQKNTITAVQNYNLSFNVNKPATTSLLTINSVTVPSGFVLDNIAAQYAPPIFGKTADLIAHNNPSFPYNIQAYDSPSLNSNNSYIRLNASANSHTWTSVNKYNKGSSVSISPQFTAFPTLQTGQTGNVTWSQASANTSIVGAYTMNSIAVSNTGSSQMLWQFLLPPASKQLQFPNIPSHINPILNPNTTYDLQISSHIVGTYTYQQYLAEDFSTLSAYPMPWEVIQQNNVIYTP